MNFYNDIEQFACEWMSKLIANGSLPNGDVSSTSISDLSIDDVMLYQQVHLFSGIGGWSYALRLAGWPESRRVWTGSCPCQPFSNAGKRKGTEDERHLWPEMRRLIEECKPPTIFGEQVASKAGRDWLATVRTDLEALGYEVGCADLCGASVGAPHIRQRLYWVANSAGEGRCRRESVGDGRYEEPRGSSAILHGGLANSESVGAPHIRQRLYWVANTDCPRSQGRQQPVSSSVGPDGRFESCGVHDWSNVEYIPCRDGKARPVMPGVRLLAHGFPNRVGLLRGFGNAIIPQVAATFIRAFLDTESERCYQTNKGQ